MNVIEYVSGDSTTRGSTSVRGGDGVTITQHAGNRNHGGVLTSEWSAIAPPEPV